MIKLGRNDPCHCGSGKKYKKCHLDADQRSRAGLRQSQLGSESGPSSLTIQDVPKLLRQFSKHGSSKARKEFGELLSETAPIVEYLTCRKEIEAAALELEAHRSEFEELAADEDRYLVLAQAVFAEECFAPLRFTASDVKRAFDQVGYPAIMSPNEEAGRILRAAILHVADNARRSHLAMSLLLRLPEFVAAGRYVEGWLLQHLSVETVECDEESNAFLFQMFSHGYDAWAAEKRAMDESLLRKLGLDPDRARNMSLDELDSWIRSQGSDPGTAGAVESFFRENPHLREETVANLQALERNSVKLLEREDSRFLHLPDEEVEPWLALFNERASQQGFLSGPSAGADTEERAHKIFKELALPLLREMADSLFTRERILQLVTDLRKYRSDRFASGDSVTAQHALGAVNYIARENSPGENTFLITLCWASLESAITLAVSENGPGVE